MSANAYLGGWGIAARARSRRRRRHLPTRHRRLARRRPGGVVVGLGDATTGIALAGAVVAGHVIECGAQATGGNYSFFDEIPDLTEPPGFPIAEIDRDGSSRHHQASRHRRPGQRRHGHRPTALRDRRSAVPQPRRRSPTSASIHLDDDGPDRVRIRGVRGLAGPADHEGVHQLRRRLPQPDDVRAHRACTRQRRRTGPSRRCSPGSAARIASTRSTCGSSPAPPDAVGPGGLVGQAARHRQVRRRARRRPGVLVGRRRAGAGQLSGLLRLVATDRGPAVRRLLAGPGGQRRRPPGGRAGRRHGDAADRLRRRPGRTSPARRGRRRRSSTPHRSGRARASRWALYFGARSGDKGGNANVGRLGHATPPATPGSTSTSPPR